MAASPSLRVEVSTARPMVGAAFTVTVFPDAAALAALGAATDARLQSWFLGRPGRTAEAYCLVVQVAREAERYEQLTDFGYLASLAGTKVRADSKATVRLIDSAWSFSVRRLSFA